MAGAAVILVLGLLAVAGVASWVLGVAADAPSLAFCKKPTGHGNTVIYAGDGAPLGRVKSEEAHAPVGLDRIPRQLQQATIAIEDRRFYEHGGIDPEGILRAALKDLEAGRAVEGGSTIAQQLVRKLCIANPSRSLERKIVEAKLAIEYAKRHSRREILAQYLNTASYGTVEGSTAVGVGAASLIYFSRPVWKLDLARAALLAGLPQAPSRYNPILYPRAARARRDEVLAAMAEQGFVSAARARAARRRDLGLDLSRGFFSHREPRFFDYVEARLIDTYGAKAVRDGGLRVHTTIDLGLQRVALAAMRTALPYPTDPAAALVAIDPRTGAIKAMASSASYSRSRFNLAAQSRRQPGSTFKTFVLTTAIKRGIDPYSTYYASKPLDLDLPRWGHWTVHTADEGYQGTINLRRATVTSDNTVFAQLDLDVGPASVARTARSMGIETKLDGIPAEGIGGLRIGVSPLELADAYATLAAGGVRRRPVAIRKVVFPDGRVERPERARPRRVLGRPVAYEVTRLLHDNIAEGTGAAAYTGCPGQAGKTGTTDDYTDAWFAGYQPNLATAVWVGYPQSTGVSMTSVHGITVFGGTFPAEIWHFLYADGGVKCVEFERPPGRVNWAPYFGPRAAPPPARGAAAAECRTNHAVACESRHSTGGGGPPGSAAVGGYDPSAYAPGVGQEPTFAPPPRRGGKGGGEVGIGAGEAAGGVGSG